VARSVIRKSEVKSQIAEVNPTEFDFTSSSLLLLLHLPFATRPETHSLHIEILVEYWTVRRSATF